MKLRLLLLLAALLVTGMAIWVSLHSRAEARQRATEARNAMRKAVEFLKPDTTSDLRFGKSKSSNTATPAPNAP